MTRVRRHTERWAYRLAVALVASAVLHTGPFVVLRRLGVANPLALEMRVQTVEIGLEDAHAGAPVSPPASTNPADLRPAAPPPPEPPRAPARPPRDRVERRPPPEEPGELPELRTNLREPQLAPPRRRPTPIDPPPLALTPPPALPTDAGAPPAEPRGFVPSIASAARDLTPLVPRGALVSVLLRADHVRDDPNAPAVRRMLGGIRDWNAMLGGSDLDPLRDLDTVLLAASQPFGTESQAPDWFVVVRGAGGSNEALRHAVERMAAPPPDPDGTSGTAPSPLHPPALDGGDDDAASANSRTVPPGIRLPDGGVAPGGPPPIWHPAANGAEFVTLERYGARRSFVMLGDGMAAIAMPGQVNRLVAAFARRSPTLVPTDDARLALLVEAEGVRNLVAFDTVNGPFPMPRRAALAVNQTLDDARRATGGAELRSSWAYDDEATAARAADMLEGSRRTWHRLISENFGARGGLMGALRGLGAGMLGVNVAELEGAIDALVFRAEGTNLTVRAELTPGQVRAMLNVAALGASAAR